MFAISRGSYPARAMICDPSRSACFSNSRLNRRNAAPSPNWVPCAMALPVRPPTIAPSTAPTSVPTSYGVAFVACAVPCRSATWLISCAMTPATSPSLLAASIIPRLTYIGPPGSANALISRTLTTLNVYWNSGCCWPDGIPCTRRLPMSDTYDVTASSRRIGSCCSTCSAASRPSWTSCFVVYLFLGGLMTVCAARTCTDTSAATTAEVKRDTRIRGS